MTRIKMFKKLSAAACTLLIAGSISACGTTPEAPCADGQIQATIGTDGMAACYTKCTADSECGASEECKDYGSYQLCVEKKTTDMNNTNNMNNPTCNITCQTTASTCEGTKAVSYSAASKNDDTCMCEGNERMEVECADTGEICVNGACAQDPEDWTQACLDFAEIQFGSCVENICMGLTDAQKMQNTSNKTTFIDGGVNGNGQMVAACKEVAKDPNQTQLRGLLNQVRSGMLTCNPMNLKSVFCQEYGDDACGCMPPTVGTACTDNMGCDGGDLMGICLPETDMNGMMTGPPGGQCVAGPCSVGDNPMAGQIAVSPATGCGENACQVFQTAQGLAQVCVATCEQNSDCDRAVDATGANGSYACNIIGLFRNTQTMMVAGAAGFCEAACTTANEATDCEPLMDQQGNMINRVCSTTFTCAPTCDTDADCATTSGPDHTCVDDTANGATAKHCKVVFTPAP